MPIGGTETRAVGRSLDRGPGRFPTRAGLVIVLGALWGAVLVVPRGGAQDEGPGRAITPNTIRIQPLEGGGEGHWIRLPGYAETGSPTFSPDGQWIAFDAYKGGFDGSPAECWIARRDGTEPTRLTVGATPRWSPDGTRLIFMRDDVNDPSREPGIFVINRDGTGERRIGAGRWPDWSPDGERIAFSLGGRRGPWGGTRIMARTYVAAADGSGRTLVADGDCPSWSPDGTRIACCQQDPAFPTPFIRIVDLETGAQRIAGFGWYRANWSPDGEHLVANGLVGPREVGMIRLSASRPAEPEPLLPGFERALSPCYSPDGASLVFIARRPAEAEDGGADRSR